MARSTTRLIRAGSIAGLAAAVELMAPSPVLAEPYIAMRNGFTCSVCHVNMTGGGKRNMFGVTYGLEMLPAHSVRLPEGTEPFGGDINDHLSVGADLRDVNAARFARSATTDTFSTQEGNLYVDLEPLKNRLHLYADEHLAPGGTQSRELFALAEGLPGHLYLKAGRFFAPFGWRLLDDGAFIRARTGFNFSSPDDGVEIGWEPGRFSANLAVTNGNGGAADNNTNKRVSIISAWTCPHFRIGSSFSSNRQGDVTSLLGGLLAGVKLGRRLVAFGEADLQRDQNDRTSTTTRQLIAFGEADLLLGKGWNLKGAFDYNDPDTSQKGDEVNRVTLGVEYFATQYVQFRLLWRRTDRPPAVHRTVFEDDREALGELHLFL